MKLTDNLKRNLEPSRILRRLELLAFFLALIATVALTVIGVVRTNRDAGPYDAIGTVTLTRVGSAEEDGYDEDSAVCTVIYRRIVGEDDDGNPVFGETDGFPCTVRYSYAEWEALPEGATLVAFGYRFESGVTVAFEYPAHEPAVRDAVRDLQAEVAMPCFSAAIALLLLTLSIGVVTFFARQFSAYEKIWFLSIMVLACAVSIALPEESANGVSGIWIMLLYLLDTFLNILCELLISKQSKWNFIVSVAVEIVEILVCIVLMYRFATMLTTLFFWLPIDILSFINWNRHKDSEEAELTRVRRLTGWQEVLVLLGIALWTAGIGYLLSGLDIHTDLFGGNEAIANLVCYLDACASAVGIANGLFIFFRFREQWVAWYISAILEAVINILAGQYVLLVLKVGYLTNSTYGYIKWSRYIRTHRTEAEEKREFF